MKTFTTPCFIRKNTPELREKLEELGWEDSGVLNIPDCLLVLDHTDGMYADCSADNEYAIHMFLNDGFIDCSTNEPLFLAIAALREGSDYGQWFTDGKDWIQSEREDWVDNISCLCSGGMYNYDKNGELSKNFSKATVEELINHFK